MTDKNELRVSGTVSKLKVRSSLGDVRGLLRKGMLR